MNDLKYAMWIRYIPGVYKHRLGFLGFKIKIEIRVLIGIAHTKFIVVTWPVNDTDFDLNLVLTRHVIMVMTSVSTTRNLVGSDYYFTTSTVSSLPIRFGSDSVIVRPLYQQYEFMYCLCRIFLDFYLRTLFHPT